MKKYVGIFIAFAILFSAGLASAIFPQDTKNQALLTFANNRDPLPGIGNIINWTKNMLRCTYSFATLGGATGTINLLDDQGNTCTLPKGSIVTRSWINVTTGVTAGSNSAMGISTQVATGDITGGANNSKTLSSFSSTGFTDLTQTGAASLFAGPVTATAGSAVQMALGTATITAGVFELFLEYVIQ